MTRYYVGDSYESHVSASYAGAVRFVRAMARRRPGNVVVIAWTKHNQEYRERFVWHDGDLFPHYKRGL